MCNKNFLRVSVIETRENDNTYTSYTQLNNVVRLLLPSPLKGILFYLDVRRLLADCM